MSAVANVLAVWVGKLTLALLRLLGRRGNALPGLVVEKVFPRYLARAMAALPEGVVVVTGTNGKTTTTKMVATILAQHYRVLTNDTGSNFVRGAITATVEHARWSGRLPYDVAVFELDEAWAVRFVEAVPPRRALLLNVMRDQLDRFGEIDTTAGLLGKVAAATTGHLVLNRDDERIAAAGGADRGDVSYYGVSRRAARAVPDRRGALRRARAGGRSADDARNCCACPAVGEPLLMRIGASEHDVDCAPKARTMRRTRPERLRSRSPSASTTRRSPPVWPGVARVRTRPALRRRRPRGRAATGQEPGRVPADAAHARHHRRRGDRRRDQRRLRRRP